MNVLFNGFDTQEVTFKSMTPVIVNRAVSLQNNGELYYADAGQVFTGVVTNYRNGIVSVVMHGHATATYKGTVPTVGICKLSVGSMGQFEVDEANGKPFTVFAVDTATKTFEFFI